MKNEKKSEHVIGLIGCGIMCAMALYMGLPAMVGMTRLRHNHSETTAEVVDIRRLAGRGVTRAYYRFNVWQA